MKRRYNRDFKDWSEALKIVVVCILFVVAISNIPELMIK